MGWYREGDIENLSELIDAVLANNGHTRDEIVCVLWGGSDSIGESSISVDLESFWKYAENNVWDNEEWCSGPPYPLALLSGKGWWLESTEYDSRTSLGFFCEPKVKPPKLGIAAGGELVDFTENVTKEN